MDDSDIDAILIALRLHSPKDDEARKGIDYVERLTTNTSLRQVFATSVSVLLTDVPPSQVR